MFVNLISYNKILDALKQLNFKCKHWNNLFSFTIEFPEFKQLNLRLSRFIISVYFTHQ